MSNRKTLEEKIEMQKVKAEQEANNLKKLLQEQKAEERKARNHRLCKRGGIVEKLLPGLAVMSDEKFDTFVQKVLLTPHTKRIISELVPSAQIEADNGTDKKSNGNEATAKTEDTAVRPNIAPADKPTVTAHANGSNGIGSTATSTKAG